MRLVPVRVDPNLSHWGCGRKRELVKQGALKSEMQHLAPPVRCDDDEKIPTDASRRAHGAGGDEVAGDVPAEHRLVLTQRFLHRSGC